MKCYEQPKLPVTQVIILTESTSQHETSPSKGSHSIPLNALEGGEHSDTAHDKQQTTVLVKYKHTLTKSSWVFQISTKYFTLCHTAQIKTQWVLSSLHRKFIRAKWVQHVFLHKLLNIRSLLLQQSGIKSMWQNLSPKKLKVLQWWVYSC